MDEENKVTETTEVQEAKTSEVVETMMNNGVTKEELKELLQEFLVKSEPAVDVEAASNDYFTSLLKGVK